MHGREPLRDSSLIQLEEKKLILAHSLLHSRRFLHVRAFHPLNAYICAITVGDAEVTPKRSLPKTLRKP